MTKEEFTLTRKKLDKTQKELAALLGVSIKTVHSYEQGLRVIPTHIERLLYFYILKSKTDGSEITPCWESTDCGRKEQCPAWEYHGGYMCWFFNGTQTLCKELKEVNDEKERIAICKSCKVLSNLIR